jgi:hypothetical protein
MIFPPHPGGLGGLGHILMLFVEGFFFLLMLGIFVVVTFLLIRFLLVATKAARLYVDKNEPTTPTARATAVTPAAPAAASPSTTTTKPAPRARTPKPPSA